MANACMVKGLFQVQIHDCIVAVQQVHNNYPYSIQQSRAAAEHTQHSPVTSAYSSLVTVTCKQQLAGLQDLDGAGGGN